MTNATRHAELRRLATAVLLPATAESHVGPALTAFLSSGGRAVLLGEHRAEYVARRMSEDRRRIETREAFSALIAAIAAPAPGPVLVAVDQELGGIQRAHGLVPALPSVAEALTLSPDALAAACARTARGLRELGVGLTLGPIVDLIDAPQPWLDGRHLGDDAERTGRIAATYVRAFEDAGVATCPKHFPGHRGLCTDPAIEARAVVPGDLAAVTQDLRPFDTAIRAGATAMMVGPAVVPALDPTRPALLSPAVLRMLRDDLDFRGLVVSDDLDARSVLDGRTLHEAAVAALGAGNDLLMVSAANDLPAIAEALAEAVEHGTLEEARLTAAAARVAATAERFGAASASPAPEPGPTPCENAFPGPLPAR